MVGRKRERSFIDYGWYSYIAINLSNCLLNNLVIVFILLLIYPSFLLAELSRIRRVAEGLPRRLNCGLIILFRDLIRLTASLGIISRDLIGFLRSRNNKVERLSGAIAIGLSTILVDF